MTPEPDRNERNNQHKGPNSWPPPWLLPPTMSPTKTHWASTRPSRPASESSQSIAVPPASFDELIGGVHAHSPTNGIAQLESDFAVWNPSDGKVFNKQFALDVETSKIVDHEVPEYILGAATDGERGCFVEPCHVFEFLTAHWDLEMIVYHCAFDLAVLNALLKAQNRPMDIYALVDERKISDVQIMHRLVVLGTEGHTCQGPGESTLDACVRRYLRVELPKAKLDDDNEDVRTSWAKWRGHPVSGIPKIYLDYLTADVVCTWRCWMNLMTVLHGLYAQASRAWGFRDGDWLNRAVQRYGPQTHDLQVMAAVALDRIERVGIGIDLAERNRIASNLQQIESRLREQLGKHRYNVHDAGSQTRLQEIIHQSPVDARCGDGRTALRLAAARGKTLIVEALLGARTSTAMKDAKGRLPVQLAAPAASSALALERSPGPGSVS